MIDPRKSLWTTEEVQQIANEENINLRGHRYSLSGLLTHPDGASRSEIVEMLRMLAGIPE